MPKSLHNPESRKTDKRTSLFWTVAAGFMAVLLISILSYKVQTIFKARIINQQQQLLFNQARDAAFYLSTHLQEHKHQLRFLTQLPELKSAVSNNNIDQIQDLIRNFFISHGDAIGDITLFDIDSNVLWQYSEKGATTGHGQQAPLLPRQVLPDNEMSSGVVEITSGVSPVSDQVIFFSSPIYSKHKLAGFIRVTHLLKKLAPLAIGVLQTFESQHILLLNKKGEIICQSSSSRKLQSGTGTKHPDFSLNAALESIRMSKNEQPDLIGGITIPAMDSKPGGRLGILENETHMFASSQMQVRSLGWTIIVIQDRDTVMDPIRQHGINLFAINLLTIAIFLGLLSYLRHNNNLEKTKTSDNLHSLAKANEALIDMKATLQSILRAAPVGIALVDKEGLRWVNDRFCHISGFSSEDLVRQKPSMLFENSGEYQRVDRVMTSQLQLQANSQIYTKWCLQDGKICDILLRSSFINPAIPNSGIIWSIVDISKQKILEASLSESVSRFTNLFKAVGSGITIYSPVSDGVDFVLKDINPAAEQIDRVKKPEVIDRKITAIFPNVKSLGLFDSLQRVAKSGLSEHLPVTCYNYKNNISWRENHIYRLPSGHLVVVCNDITEKRQAQLELENREQMLRQIIDNLPHSIFIKNRKGQFILVNRSTAELVDLTVEEITGSTQKKGRRNIDLIERWHEEDLKVIETGETITVPEETVIDTNGRRRILHTVKIPFRFDDSGEPGVLGISVDITKIKESETENLLLERQLFQAQKMETIGTLASGIAHEINNPNNFIMLNTPVLEQIFRAATSSLEYRYQQEGDFFIGKMRYSKVRDKAPALFSGIADGSRRVKEIVEELKNFSRRELTPRFEEVDIYQVIESAAKLLENLIKKSCSKLVFIRHAEAALVKGSFQRLEQVVINLLQNSCQAQQDNNNPIEVTVDSDLNNAMISITIRDYGTGIKKAILGQIKEPFFTTKRESKGTGLGLSVSDRIIREHEGTLDLSSSPATGTVVIITIPASSKQ